MCAVPLAPLLALTLAGCHAQSPEVVFGHEDPSQNLVQNWDLETPVSRPEWWIRNTQYEQGAPGYTGQSSITFTQRTKEWGGAIVTASLPEGELVKSDTSYYFSSFVNLLNNATSSPYSSVKLYVRERYLDGSNKLKQVARLPYAMATGEWKQIGGDHRTSARTDIKSVEMEVRVKPTSINYRMDTASITEMPKYADWKEAINEKIEKVRTSPVTIRGSFPADSEDITVSFSPVKRDFGWGMAIKSFIFKRESDTAYKNFILDNFNWAVFENDMKWKQMEKNEGAIKVSDVDAVLDILEDNGITVRGHAIVWDKKKANPGWAEKETGDRLYTDVFRRLNYTMSHFKGRVFEWDVCNEYLHHHFLEDGTGDIGLLHEELRMAHEIDPDTRLFLNDYEVVRTPMYTSAQATLARQLLFQGLPVHGVGVQSHLRDIPMHPEVLEKRVQIAASAGLPVAMTEFSVHHNDVEVRKDALDMALRIYYSNPAVESVTFWGHSDVPGYSFTDDMYLTTGIDMTPNPAGAAMLNLINNEFKTDKTFTSASQDFEQTFNAHHGTYRLTATAGGQTVYSADVNVVRGEGTDVTMEF